jgi:hypothetical protein
MKSEFISLENIIDRLEELSIYIEEMEECGRVNEYPRLFASYISEKIDKIREEVGLLENVLKDKLEKNQNG